VQPVPSALDLTETLLGLLSRYVSAPTAQSIVKLARQRANVTSSRIDRARLGDMLGPIERNLRLFIDEPSRVAECCAAIQALTEASPGIPSATPSASTTPPTPSPSSVRYSSPGPPSTLGGPLSVRFSPAPPPSASRTSSPGFMPSPPMTGPSSVRYPSPLPSTGRASSPGGAPSSVRTFSPVTLPTVSDADPISVRAPGSVRSPPSARYALIPIRTEDDITRARSEARDIATKLGFSVVGRTRLVTAVSELARNIVLYVGEGQVELHLLSSPDGLSVIARDHGPGIPNLDQIMAGDYKSRLGMGLGLRGVKRIADRFDIQTAAGQGTTVSFSLKVM
jgi:anti-sigma regulatory factor (Ser/Thr protein kinase)